MVSVPANSAPSLAGVSVSTLGRSPEKTTLVLTQGADFTQILQLSGNERFPVDTVVTICFYEDPNDSTPIAVWEGDTLSTRVEWRVESELADEISDRAPFRMYVSYPEEPTLEHCWFIGRVARQQ